jgi:hypothetical protein
MDAVTTSRSSASDGCYDQTANRLRYIKHLRTSRPRSPRTEADAEHVKAKTEMLQLKLAEKRRDLVRQSDVDALIDEIVGVTLTAMSSMPARCAPRGDLATRRCIEQVVFEMRTEIATSPSVRLPKPASRLWMFEIQCCWTRKDSDQRPVC